MKATDQQRAAVEARAPQICVDAGAGSGKTRVLVERIVCLIETGETDLDRIAAITFTDKAAAEMKARLRQAFRQRASTADRETMTRWRNYERRIDGAKIQTIHAFCAGMLREHALRLGLDPDFALQTEADSALTRRRIVRGTLHTLFEQEDDAAIRLATAFPLATLEEVFGRMLQNAIKTEQALSHGPHDDPEALQAYWTARAEDWKEARYDYLKHSAKLRKFQAELLGMEKICQNAADGREIWRVQMLEGLMMLIRGFKGKYRKAAIAKLAEKPPERGASKNWESPAAFKEITRIQNNVSRFAKDFQAAFTPDPPVEAEAAQHSCDLAVVYGAIATAYTGAKQAANVLDFEDLLLRTHAALTRDPDFAAHVAADFDHLLIDEFQDTDDIQLALAHALAAAPSGPQLFYVGDAKQSIYRFRGADVGVFLDARDGAARKIALDTNFRSAENVIEFVNDYFTESGLLASVTGLDEPVRLEPHRPAMEGPRVELLSPLQPEGRWDAPARREAEAALIAAHLHRLCNGKDAIEVWDDSLKGTRPAAYGDAAILFRAMSDVGLYQRELRAAGIPYTSTAGSGFYRLQEVYDIVNLCKVVLDPWDEPALFAFLRSPLAALSDESLYRMTRKQPLVAAFLGAENDDLPAGEAARLAAARALAANLRAGMDAPLADFLHRIVNETGIEAILLGQHHGVQKASNIRKLLTLASNFSGRRPPSLRAFVEYVDAVREGRLTEGEAPLQPEGAGAVTLMTIHKSKGLEFPVVFVADTGRAIDARNTSVLAMNRHLGVTLSVYDEDGKTQSAMLTTAIAEREAAEQEAESARLLYVALTRARDHLVLCGAPGSQAGSWWESVNAHLQIDNAPDGDVIAMDRWQARVVRNAPVVTLSRAAAAAREVDRDRIARRLEAIGGRDAAAESIPITTLLKAMAGDADAEAVPWDDAPSRLVSPEQQNAMRRGSLVHRMFEVWNMRAGSDPPWEVIFAGAGISLEARPAAQADLASIADRFLKSPAGTLLHDASRVAKEHPFLLHLDGVWLRGTIDLLIPGGAMIDFKTGAFHAARHESYTQQLRLYAAAAAQLGGPQPSHGILAYVDADREVAVDFGADELANTLTRARAAIEALKTATGHTPVSSGT